LLFNVFKCALHNEHISVSFLPFTDYITFGINDELDSTCNRRHDYSAKYHWTRFWCKVFVRINLTSLVINQPAGHVEANETLVEAAIRETLEETGYTVSIDSVLGIYTFTPPDDPECTYYRICFFANVESFDAARTLDTGIVRTIWLTLDELKATGRARSPLVIRCLEDALAGQRFPLSMIFEQPRIAGER
jgi:ADP-ribose pyrophosphatase YjhB (NUDIX family)